MFLQRAGRKKRSGNIAETCWSGDGEDLRLTAPHLREVLWKNCVKYSPPALTAAGGGEGGMEPHRTELGLSEGQMIL